MSGFDAKYKVDENGCWLWQGYVAANGYGRIYDKAKRSIIWVHRYAYEMHKGPIADRHEIDHTCEVTRCVNPAHLDQVTRTEHIRRTYRRLGKDDLHLAAAELRQTGLTYADIAQALSLAGKDSAYQAVQAAITKGLVAHDTIPRLSNLTEADYEDIRAMYAFGIPQTAIARFYEIDSSQVSRIVNFKRGSRRAA